jgi:hypothetical protein
MNLCLKYSELFNNNDFLNISLSAISNSVYEIREYFENTHFIKIINSEVNTYNIVKSKNEYCNAIMRRIKDDIFNT